MTGLANTWMGDRPDGAQYIYMLGFNKIYASVFLSIRGVKQWIAWLVYGGVAIQPDVFDFALFGQVQLLLSGLIHCRGLLHCENVLVVDWFSQKP